jgi:hypothetical protein
MRAGLSHPEAIHGPHFGLSLSMLSGKSGVLMFAIEAFPKGRTSSAGSQT